MATVRALMEPQEGSSGLTGAFAVSGMTHLSLSGDSPCKQWSWQEDRGRLPGILLQRWWGAPETGWQGARRWAWAGQRQQRSPGEHACYLMGDHCSWKCGVLPVREGNLIIANSMSCLSSAFNLFPVFHIQKLIFSKNNPLRYPMGTFLPFPSLTFL